MTIASPNLSPSYASRVLMLFSKLFEMSEKNPGEKSLENLCASLAKLAQIPSKELEAWLNHLVQGE